MTSLLEYQLELLSQEIEVIHSRIREYDEISFKVKGWSITLWIAIIGYSLREDGNLYVILISIPALILFWMIDAMFKSYQLQVRNRLGRIEEFLNSEQDFTSCGLRQSFESEKIDDFPIHDPMGYKTRKIYTTSSSFLDKAVLTWNVFMVHLVLTVASVVIFIVSICR